MQKKKYSGFSNWDLDIMKTRFLPHAGHLRRLPIAKPITIDIAKGQSMTKETFLKATTSYEPAKVLMTTKKISAATTHRPTAKHKATAMRR
jgi:hypothetical protein